MKKSLKTLNVFSTAAAIVLSLSAAAHAEDKNTRTMLNSSRVVSMLDGVLPHRINTIVDKLEAGELRRVAPEMPLVLLEQIDGTILYYQGQPTFKGKPANALVDDEGKRFGTIALQRGRISKSGWQTLTLGNAKYRMYCHNLAPFIACTLQV
ncbi:hypothetical protein [Comamonas thiooxydans]|uniref:hypothetical protein n=1 Tax=Comamonas thiooxydans TaxID=363952 RepID=UPI0011866994|nr:hypothetical protein [Comamonas thiooxydans]